MIISKPDDGAGLLYHIIDLNGQTVHAYRDAVTAVRALEGDQRLAVWDDRFMQWRNTPTRTTSERPVSKGVLGYGPNRERRMSEIQAKRYTMGMFSALEQEGDAVCVARTMTFGDKHELMCVLVGGKFYLGCQTLDVIHWDRYFGVRVS